jgi:cytochrome c6
MKFWKKSGKLCAAWEKSRNAKMNAGELQVDSACDTDKNKEEHYMKKGLVALVALLAVSLFATSGQADTKKGAKINGANEFKEHCAVCHPNGGNIINPQKKLDKKSLAADNVKTTKDIINKMRNPGPGMTKFDTKSISNKEAKAIADYIQKAFK